MHTISERQGQPINVLRKSLFCLFRLFPVPAGHVKEERNPVPRQQFHHGSSADPPRIGRGSHVLPPEDYLVAERMDIATLGKCSTAENV